MLGFFISGIGKAKECHKDKPCDRPHPRDLLVRWWGSIQMLPQSEDRGDREQTVKAEVL